MDLLSPQKVKMHKKLEVEETLHRNSMLEREQKRLITNLNNLREAEKVTKKRIEADEVERQKDLRTRKTELDTQVGILEGRKRQALIPVDAKLEMVNQKERNNDERNKEIDKTEINLGERKVELDKVSSFIRAKERDIKAEENSLRERRGKVETDRNNFEKNKEAFEEKKISLNKREIVVETRELEVLDREMKANAKEKTNIVTEKEINRQRIDIDNEKSEINSKYTELGRAVDEARQNKLIK